MGLFKQYKQSLNDIGYCYYEDNMKDLIFESKNGVSVK